LQNSQKKIIPLEVKCIKSKFLRKAIPNKINRSHSPRREIILDNVALRILRLIPGKDFRKVQSDKKIMLND